MAFYAHSLENESPDKWETMAEHEERVAKLCGKFLERIHSDLAPWGDLLGRWHDLGKYSKAFQDYLLRSNDFNASCEGIGKRVDHSSAGAQHANNALPKGISRLFAYAIAGHHSGLADAHSTTGITSSGLNERLRKPIEPIQHLLPKEVLEAPTLSIPDLAFDTSNTGRLAFQTSAFCRFLFSSLCDADFLATERFMSPKQFRQRPAAKRRDLANMQMELNKFLNDLNKAQKASDVNGHRAEILYAARSAATHPPGFHSFTVPTGGGKTLASLSFGLAHALNHDLARVIYAIPYTSIIEQTADVFRNVFSSDPNRVLEHHSNVDPENESLVSRLASQNWDAPLVVTTNVQFFESLFANRTSHCRKLHRIAKSVIILDEAQMIPVDYLQPCLEMLRTLVDLFGCTIVLCTATQPAIGKRNDFQIGLPKVMEIIPDPRQLYSDMRRVDVKLIGEKSNREVVELIANEGSSLCIVNTKKHALDLFELISKEFPRDQLFHLSTNMCAAHRKSKLDSIRARLNGEKKLPCTVVSTQLIEAGVDVDFPVVFRALSGLDSIAQAAGLQS